MLKKDTSPNWTSALLKNISAKSVTIVIMFVVNIDRVIHSSIKGSLDVYKYTTRIKLITCTADILELFCCI